MVEGCMVIYVTNIVLIDRVLDFVTPIELKMHLLF